MHTRLFARSCDTIVHIRMQILQYDSTRIPPSVGNEGVIENLVTRISWFLITRIVCDLTRTYSQISTGSLFAREQTIRKSIAIDFDPTSNAMIPTSNWLQPFGWKLIDFNPFRSQIGRNHSAEQSIAMISLRHNRFQSISDWNRQKSFRRAMDCNRLYHQKWW